MDTTQTLTIEPLTDHHEEVRMSHTVGGRTSHTYYQLGKINFEHVEKNSVIIATFVFMGKDFNECSILRMGPDSGQRRYSYLRNFICHFLWYLYILIYCSLQQLKLSDLGDEMRVEIDHVLPDGQSLKLIKRLERVPATVESGTVSFSSSDLVNNWTKPATHAPSVLKKVMLSIVDTINVQTSKNSQPIRTGSSALPPGSPESEKIVPKVMRRFNGELSNGENVTLFVIQVLWRND